MLLQDLAVQSVINLTIVVLLFILGLITSFRQMKLEKIVSRTFYFGVGLFFITYGICRLIFWLGPFFDLVLPDFKFGYFVGNTIGLGSVVILMYAVESNILTRSKHFFSIYGTMGVVLMIISIFVRVQWYGNSFIAWIQYFTVPVLGGVFVLIFFFLSIKTKGRARTYSLIVVIGVISLCFGEMANTSIANQIFPWIGPLYINSILILIGAILIFSFSWNIEQYFKLLKEYYTTKRICFVHRGKIIGKIYFCPHCFVKYCEKCFKSVIKTENTCWVCDSKFERELESYEEVIIEEPKQIDNNESLHKLKKTQ